MADSISVRLIQIENSLMMKGLVLMIINVTAQHIANGRRASIGGCPVALALQQYFPLATVAGPYFRTVAGNSPEINLPDYVTTFIEKFDEGKPVEPFNFLIPDNLEAPTP